MVLLWNSSPPSGSGKYWPNVGNSKGCSLVSNALTFYKNWTVICEITNCYYRQERQHGCFNWVENLCGTLRKLQLKVQQFNETNALVIFAFKNVLQGAVMICGASGIQFFHKHPLLSLINFVVVLQCFLSYGFMYGKGFDVRRKVQGLQLVANCELKRRGNGIDSKYLQRCILSVRIPGIRVGTFHLLQRTSIPQFLDFSVKHVARMIILLRRYSA